MAKSFTAIKAGSARLPPPMPITRVFGILFKGLWFRLLFVETKEHFVALSHSHRSQVGATGREG